MIQELIYTSAPFGLRPGAVGFTTVAKTPELPGELADRMEGLSRYRHRSVLREPNETQNPTAYSHQLVMLGHQSIHVLSRIADVGLDYTGRSNFLAHHLAIASAERLPQAGPAWLLQQRGIFLTHWDRDPGLLPPDRLLPDGRNPGGRCLAWNEITGDSGWGGTLASATNPAEPVYIVFQPGQDVLPLIAESVALLPASERWRATFSTYFAGVVAGVQCQWRCVPSDSPEARAAIEARRGLVLRLDQRMAGEPTGAFVEAARTGKRLENVPFSPAASASAPRSPSAEQFAPRSSAARNAIPTSYPAPLVLPNEPGEPDVALVTVRPAAKILGIVAGLAVGVIGGAGAVLAFQKATGTSFVTVATPPTTPGEDHTQQIEALQKQLEEAKRPVPVSIEKLPPRSESDLERLHQGAVAEMKKAQLEVATAKKERDGIETKFNEAETARKTLAEKNEELRAQLAEAPKSNGSGSSLQPVILENMPLVGGGMEATIVKLGSKYNGKYTKLAIYDLPKRLGKDPKSNDKHLILFDTQSKLEPPVNVDPKEVKRPTLEFELTDHGEVIQRSSDNSVLNHLGRPILGVIPTGKDGPAPVYLACFKLTEITDVAKLTLGNGRPINEENKWNRRYANESGSNALGSDQLGSSARVRVKYKKLDKIYTAEYTLTPDKNKSLVYQSDEFTIKMVLEKPKEPEKKQLAVTIKLNDNAGFVAIETECWILSAELVRQITEAPGNPKIPVIRFGRQSK